MIRSYPINNSNNDDDDLNNFYDSLPDELKTVVDKMCNDLKRSQNIDGYVKAIGEMRMNISDKITAKGFLFECNDSNRGKFWISFAK